MTNAISAIIDLKVRLEAENRKAKSKSVVGFLGFLQMICLCVLMVLESPAGPMIMMAVMVSYTFTLALMIGIKKEALAPIVDALLEIEERLDSTHD